MLPGVSHFHFISLGEAHLAELRSAAEATSAALPQILLGEEPRATAMLA